MTDDVFFQNKMHATGDDDLCLTQDYLRWAILILVLTSKAWKTHKTYIILQDADENLR